MDGANSSVSDEATATFSGCSTTKPHVRLDGEARRGQGALHADHVIAVEPERVGENEPALDAALLRTETVVVVDAMQPFAAELAVVRAAHQGGILARHAGLVTVAVERPGLHLALGELAAVQQLMERVLVVIALGADRADRRLEFSLGHRLAVGETLRTISFIASSRHGRILARTSPLRLISINRRSRLGAAP